MNRLNQSTLKQLPSTVTVPKYDRKKIKAGIVHIGVGAFHRGHQAFYTDTVLNQKGGDWGIIGASLRSASMSEQLMPQDCLYTLVEKNNSDQTERVIGAIQSIIVASENPQKLIELLAQDTIKIVSFTITEKGYHYNAKINGLNLDNPDIQHDLRHFRESPTTAIGYLVAALALRKEDNRTGLTLLSCDNLMHNGKILKRVVLDFADKVEPNLAQWIEAQVEFPNTMIDRIVPAPTPHDIEALANKLGVDDHAAIFTEPFCQWVIEDKFKCGRPAWEIAGALMVDNVTPFEEAKLRLLNGSHSLIAYLGNLAGYEFVHQVIEDPDFYQLVTRYMSETAPSLNVPAHFDVQAYRDQLLQRFSNSSLNHKTAQIAQDGSQKVPQRWFHSVTDARCTRLDAHALALAGWILYLAGKRDGEYYAVIDPMASQLQEIVKAGGETVVENILRLIGVGHVIAANPKHIANTKHYLQKLHDQGVKAVIHEFVSSIDHHAGN